MPVAGGAVFRLMYALIFAAVLVSRLAASLRDIDRRALVPFVRQGLLSALLVLLFVGIGLSGLACVARGMRIFRPGTTRQACRSCVRVGDSNDLLGIALDRVCVPRISSISGDPR